MGFGSGGGGFTPSPNNVPGSTQTGTDKDTDLHQFTGSVDITGSLTLNGASVTSGGGGGGGAVSTYTNSGNDRVITSVNSNTINGEANLTFNGTSLTSPQVTASVIMKTPALEISSSAAGALFRIDHADQSGPEPILFVSGSGVIGIGTDNPLASTPSDNTNRLHIVGNNGAEQGEAPVINTQLVLENDNHAGLQFMMPSGRSGQITWGIPGAARKAVFYWSSANSRYEFNGDSFGGKRIMTMLSNGDSINIGSSSSGHMTTNKASLHISSSEGGADKGGPVLLRVDHGDQPGAEPTLFVSGSGQVGIGTASPSSILHVSSSTTTLPLLRVDQHDQAGAKPILYVTGSGLVAIGTDSPRSDTSDTNRLHILAESGADQGINPAVNSALVLENNDHVGLNIITPNNRSGMIVFGDADVANRAYFRYEHGNAGQGAGTDRFFFDGTFGEEVLSIARAGDSINMGKNNSAHMLTNKASLHISSSTEGADVGGPVLLKVDHANQPGAQPTLFVTGSGRVGIGTAAPESALEVRSTTTQQKWSYDDDHEFTVTVGSNGETVLAVSGTSISPSPASDLVLDVSEGGGDILLRRSTDRLRFGISTGNTFVQTDNQNTDLVFRMHPDGGLGAIGTEIFRLDASGAGALLMSGTISAPGGNAPINFRDTANSIHSPGSNRLALTSPALEVSGSTRMSGAFGSTAFETIAATSGIANVTTGTTILDVTSQANNAFYSFAVADGAFPGQQKNFIFKSTFGGASTNTNGLQLTGSNIGTAIAGTSTGLIIMSASDSGGGYFGSVLGSAMLMWDGSKWNVMANVNTQVSAT